MPTPTLETVFSMRRLQDENGVTVFEVTNRLTDETAVGEVYQIENEV